MTVTIPAPTLLQFNAYTPSNMTKQGDPRTAGKRAKAKESNKRRQKAKKRERQLQSVETKKERKVICEAQKRQAKKAKKMRSLDAKDKQRTLALKKARGKKKTP